MARDKTQAALAKLEAFFAQGISAQTDAVALLGNAQRYAKVAADYVAAHPMMPVRIAVLGSQSIQYLVSALRLLLAAEGIDADIYEGAYGGIHMDVLDPESALYTFGPQMVVLVTHHTDIQAYPPPFADEQTLSDWVVEQLAGHGGLWARLGTIPGCQVLQSTYVSPVERPLGNLEANYTFSQSVCLQRLHAAMAQHRPAHVTLVDLEHWAARVGKDRWFDMPAFYLYKQPFAMDQVPGVARLFTRQILALLGRTRKCLVLDLDNTLWGGVVGDDGPLGILLDPNQPIGEAYRAFQRYVLALARRGVILAVCSKNEDAAARLPFEQNPYMVLTLSDIACFVANWGDKATNLAHIARQLNIGVDSLVFFDDNPAERDIVRRFLPQVAVVEVPEDPTGYVRALDDADCFAWAQLTREDVTRTQSYDADRRRQAVAGTAVDYDTYLQALEMRATVGPPLAAEVERFAQLINKSNQFNLRTQRYTQAQVEHMLEEQDTRLLCVHLRDRFSVYGLISCLVLRIRGEECFIDTWLMSCRVLKRGVEQLALDAAVETARGAGCTVLIGEYLPTDKNKMVEDFYESMGFRPDPDRAATAARGACYRYEIAAHRPGDTRIALDQAEGA